MSRRCVPHAQCPLPFDIASGSMAALMRCLLHVGHRMWMFHTAQRGPTFVLFTGIHELDGESFKPLFSVLIALLGQSNGCVPGK